MNDIILKKAEKVIAERRLAAEDRARNFLLEAYKKPEFKEIFNKIKEEEINIAKCLAFEETPNYENLKALQKQQEDLLKALNLNGTDIKPNYECKICSDEGYVYGKPCECLKREINKELLKFSGFTHSLATFAENTTSHPAYPLMEKWCNTNSNKVNIVICGHTGTGKTFLTECIASRLMEQSRVVLFTSAFNLNNSMLNYHTSFDPNRKDIIAPYLTSEVLIIDDLGTEPQLKNVTKEYLYLILNERMLANQPTIITTNLDMNGLFETYGERIFSRLVNKKVSININIDGEDLRLKNN